jgi:hypothetical protein
VIGLALRRLRTPALALVAFLTVGTFWIARAYEKTSAEPSVLPMAYSRDQPGKATRVETGYLVAETNDRVVFASLPSATSNELREFPRTETDDLEIGSLTPLRHAKARAALFAFNLCNRVDVLHSIKRTTVPCSAAYLAQLAATAGLALPVQPSLSCGLTKRMIRCLVHYPRQRGVKDTVRVSLVRVGQMVGLGPVPLRGTSSASLTALTIPQVGAWRAIVVLATAGHLEYSSSISVQLHRPMATVSHRKPADSS